MSSSGCRASRISTTHANPLFSKTLFNVTNSTNTRDNRSDDKSIEPESVVIGVVGGTRYAFVGLERDSGIAVFDLTIPTAPAFVTYVNNRKFKIRPARSSPVATLAIAATWDRRG